MELIRGEKQGQITLKVTGPLTVYEVAAFREQVLACFEEYNGLAFDLDNVTDCDTAGIQFLFSVYKTARNKKKEFTVLAASALIRETAVRVGLDFEGILDFVEKV